MAISKIVPQSTGFGDANVGLQIPNISLEDRAAEAANGSIIFNTSNNEIQVYANGAWTSVGIPPPSPLIESVSGSIDSGNTGSTVNLIGTNFDVDQALIQGTVRFNFDGTFSDVVVTPNSATTISSITVPDDILAKDPLTTGTVQFIRSDGEISNAFTKQMGSLRYFTPFYLVIAGGGGGGVGHGGGGGAGGYRTNYTSSAPVSNPKGSGGGAAVETGGKAVTGANYPVTIGAGGPGGSYPGTNNQGGSNSFFSNAVSIGGGAGGNQNGSPATGGQRDGKSGGSGGGGANTTAGNGTGGTATPGQGYNGAAAAFNGGPWASAGGGGAGAVGVSPAGTGEGGAGGAGVFSDITGSPVRRGGGGGGNGDSVQGAGGAGGGGTGSPDTPGVVGGAGTVNTGGGGGGGRAAPGGAGGSGVVILRYPNAVTISNPGGGLTFTTSTSVPGVNVTTITAGTGNISWS